jgi:transposase InsO family protein
LELGSKRQLTPLRVDVAPTTLGDYDFIFGRRYMFRYGFILDFEEKVIIWDGMRKPMRPKGYWSHEQIKEEIFLQEDCMVQEILESKYEKQDLTQVAQDQTHLTKEQRDRLEKMLKVKEKLFSGRLGHWPDDKVIIELKPGSKPYHCGKPIRIPHIHMKTLKQEMDRLEKIGVVEQISGTKAGLWCAPSWCIPKKDKRIRIITDFRELNKCIIRKPWPMPHIADLLQDIGQFRWVTALDLSMGFYNFELSEEASNLTTFMLPWGLYRYKRLPMGLSISPDFFQEKMSRLFADFPYMKVYLDDLLVFSNGSYEDHLQKVEIALQRLQSKNLAVNALKSYWAVQEVDYLGFKLTTRGILPQPRKVAAIHRMEPPKNKKQLRRFIGMVNYYRHMWKQRSHLLSPLAEMAGKNTPFKWTPECNKAFKEIKKTVSKNVLLSFPDYTKPFELYTDASDKQLGSMLKQGSNVLAFFSKKLSKSQQNYGVGEKEMLSVVESLKEFHTMVHGYPIDVFVDHKNWTHDKIIRNARVMRWRMMLEDYDITLHYVQGEKNVVADTLSRNPFSMTDTEEENYAIIEDLFDYSNWRKMSQPLTTAEISREQKKDPYTLRLQEQAPDRLGELFEDIGKKTGPDHVATEIDTKDNKQRIIVPATLRRRLVEWYHGILVHPGADRLHNTIRQHFTWPYMQDQIRKYTKQCDACQRGKRGQRGMGHIPMKDVETEPWKDIAVDLAGPWIATIDNKQVEFHTFTIIDVFTGWVEILPITTKKAEVIRDLIVQQWFRRYPRPSRVIFDAGSEFDNEWFQKILTTWYVKPEPITVKNPRANAIVERMHRVLGDMIRCQLASTHPKENVIEELTSAAAFGIRATVHGTTKYTPAQLVFNKDLILRTNMEANVELVRQRRMEAIQKNNQKENRRRIAYNYKVGDKVLILSNFMDPKLQLHRGPYRVLSFNKSNGTLHIKRNNYVEAINIRNVRPYFGALRGGD